MAIIEIIENETKCFKDFYPEGYSIAIDLLYENGFELAENSNWSQNNPSFAPCKTFEKDGQKITVTYSGYHEGSTSQIWA